MDRIENIYEVTQRLCGMITPYGDSSVDEVRLQNLKDTIEVVDNLIKDIKEVAEFANRPEHSIAVMGKEAANFLAELNEQMETKPYTISTPYGNYSPTSEEVQKMYDYLRMYFHRSQTNGLIDIDTHERGEIKRMLRHP